MIAGRAGEAAGTSSLDERAAARQPVPFVRKGLTSQSLYFSIEEVQSRMQLRVFADEAEAKLRIFVFRK